MCWPSLRGGWKPLAFRRRAFSGVAKRLAKRKVAKFMYPERLEIVGVFPQTNVDKVSKKALRKDIETKLTREKGGG